MTAAHQYRLTEEQQTLLDHADRFGREQLYPLAQRMDDDEWWPEGIFARFGELGYFGITVPEQYGGAGLDLLCAGVMLQGFARWNHALALSWVVHDNLSLNNIYRNGHEDLRRRYLPRMCTGEWIGALGLTEPGAGSDALGAMRTTATKDGEHYVLNGTKMYITNGPVADVLLVYAKTAPERGAKGISAFVIEKDFPGFRVAQELKKMGFRGCPTGELVFDECRVPAQNLVGAENEGHKVVMSGLDFERAMIAPLCVGIAERALQLSVEYAKTRVQFGQPIGKFQMIQAKLADMYVWVQTMKTFTYQVLAQASAVEMGEGGRGEIHMQTAAAVMYASQTMNRVLDEAVQIHGGSGYLWESEVNRLFRSIKLMDIGAGTTEVRKMIIGQGLLA
ncbi:MAG: isovaleryl-CoA dehydrogenase [Gammaproteobacteria bacterium]|jgi:isovaleryl-CoA dehydrogenase